MYCGKCGSQISDGAKFCHVCGTPTQQSAPAAAPVYTPAQQKAPAPKKQPDKKLIGIVAAAAALVLVVVLIASLLGGPSATVAKALSKSGKEFQAVAEELGLAGLPDLLTEKKSSQTVSVQLNGLDGLAGLEGLGVRMNVDTSLPDKKIGISMAPFVGSADLVNLQVKLEDSKIYVGSPEITDSTFYMIDTRTIGKDINDLSEHLDGYRVEMLDDLGFSLFEVLEQVEKANEGNEKAAKEAKKAFEKFAKTIEVEKEGKETLEVNGKDLKCTAYNVVLTEDGLDALLDTLEDVYKNADNTDAYMDILKSVGLPSEARSEFKDSMKSSQEDVKEAFDTLHKTLKEIGDIELDVYLNGGYIVAVVYEEDNDTITLNIGGGKKYVDNISLRMESKDYEFAIVSTGNHACSGGKFTDLTEITEVYGSNENIVAEMELSWDLKGKDDNFRFTMDVDGEELEASGYVSFGNNALVIDLEEVFIPDAVNMGVEYRLEKYAGDNIKIKNSEELAKMSNSDLEDMAMMLAENAEELVGDLLADYPDLANLF